MMVSCSVPFCKNRKGKATGISFHEFPVDETLRNKWLKAISRPDFEPNCASNSSVVCSEHFVQADYKPDIKIRVLKTGTVPSVFPRKSDEIKSTRKENVKRACAKDRWLKLRNCHRDALRRKLPKGGGQPAQAPRPWKFESQMSFLLKHMTNRPPQPANGTQELDILQDSLSLGESNQGLDNIKIEVHDDLADGLREEVESYGQQDEGSIILGFPTEAGKSDVSEERVGSDERSRDGDDLYHFFMAMYNSAKKMPLLSQLNLKRRIFNIVADEELYIYKRRAR